MSWDLISTYGPTLEDSDIEALEDTVDVQRRGYDFVGLSQWASGNTTVPAIEVGSVLEINGAVFEVNTSDIVIGTVPGGATDDLYVKLTVSGGTTVTADWSTTVPTWDTAKGGWFDGTDKFLPFVVDYDGATTWDNKRDFTIGRNNETIYTTPAGGMLATNGYASENGESFVKTRYIPLGSWDMDATEEVTIPVGTHGITDLGSKVVMLGPSIIFGDGLATDRTTFSDGYQVSSGSAPGIYRMYVDGSDTIGIVRSGGGPFDSGSFDDTPQNRGYIKVSWVE